MSGIELAQQLGLSNEELQERVVNTIADRMLRDASGYDEDGDEHSRPTRFSEAIKARVKEKVDASVEAIAARNVLPNVEAYIESLVLQETNRWGEKTGEPKTFTEYLVDRAENYLTEKVDFRGKTKAEDNGYSWKGAQSRISHMVHEHLHYRIEQAMNEAMKSANKAIVGGIEETVRLKLREVSDALKIEVKGKR